MCILYAHAYVDGKMGLASFYLQLRPQLPKEELKQVIKPM